MVDNTGNVSGIVIEFTKVGNAFQRTKEGNINTANIGPSPFLATGIGVAPKDRQYVAFASDADLYGTETGDPAFFKLIRSSTSGSLTVNLDYSGGSAVSGIDHAPLPTAVTFPPGVSALTIAAPIYQDGVHEGNETVIARILPGGDAYIRDFLPENWASTMTINDDPQVITMSVVDGTATEGGGDGKFKITRSPVLASALVIKLDAPTGNALSGSDFKALPTSVTIPANAASATVSVSAINDSETEPVETLSVALKSDPAYTLGATTSATITVEDNEKPVITMIATDAIGKEGSGDHANLRFTRLGKLSEITLKLTLGGNATAGLDYKLPTSITFPVDVAVRNFRIAIIDDLDATEGTESLLCTLAPSGDYIVGTNATVSISIEDTPCPLPTPWKTVDIGVDGSPGYAAFADATQTFTVRGVGDIDGSADMCQIVYQNLIGDGILIARVTDQLDTDGYARAGIMMRESLGAGSRHVAMVLTPNEVAQFRYRTNAGGSTNSSNKSGQKVPKWVKLVREGSVFTGYVSDDGATWIQVGSKTLALSETLKVGMVVSSNKTSVLGWATFTNVSLAPLVLTAPSSNG